MHLNGNTSIVGDSSFRCLGNLSNLLAESNFFSQTLGEALGLISVSLNGISAGIYRKWHSDSHTEQLECLGCWHHDSNLHPVGLENLDPCTIPASAWKSMEKKKSHVASYAIIGNVPDGSSRKASDPSHSVFVPLFLADHLFGFIVVCGVKESEPSGERDTFLSAVRGIFELWISKMNVQKRLDDIISFIPNPIFIMATNEKIVAWNPANEKMTGWVAAQIIGKGNYESSLPYYGIRRPMVANLIMHPDTDWEQTYYELDKKEDNVHALAFCPALPGGGAYLRTNTLRLYDVNHRLWGSIHAVRDVTLERKMREHLQRSESMYRAISDFAGVGILLIKNGDIVYFNEQILEFIGGTGEALTLYDFYQWIHPEDRIKIRISVDTLHEENLGSVRLEFRAGAQVPVGYFQASAQLLSYEDQDAVHLIIDDISEQKERDRRARLNELKLYHEGRLTSLGIMAAGIAHELNQPLNTIRVVTDGFLFGRDEGWALEPDELYESLEMVSRQVVRMSEVIQNIRNFAREDREQAFVDVNVNEAVENVFSMIGRQLEAHNIAVKKSLAQNLPAIQAHLNRLEQVIMNLVVNARQALDGCAHDNKALWIRTGIRSASVFIEIGDNATGIQEPDMAKIFDPFFTTKDVGRGTGLGLTISRSIVDEFNGRMEVFNNKQGGATFLVSAPQSGGMG